MKRIRLLSANTVTEAHLIKGRLNNEGIECFLTNQHIATLFPHYNHIEGGGVQIMVHENDVEVARKIVQDKLEPSMEKIICPHCGSSKVALGMGKLKWFKLLNMFIAALMLTPIGNLKPKYFCGDCKQEIQ